MPDIEHRPDRELADLKQRLERLQQTLQEHGYLDDGGASIKSSEAKAQADGVHTMEDFRRMERSLEELVEALTSRSAAPVPLKSLVHQDDGGAWKALSVMEAGMTGHGSGKSAYCCLVGGIGKAVSVPYGSCLIMPISPRV
jgi:hypothetical protein